MDARSRVPEREAYSRAAMDARSQVPEREASWYVAATMGFGDDAGAWRLPV